MRTVALTGSLLGLTGHAAATEPLLALYTFEQAGGRFGQVVDESGQGRAPLTFQGVSVTTDQQGYEGEAAVFALPSPQAPAQGFEVSLDFAPGAPPRGLTIGGWVNLAALGPRQTNTFFSYAQGSRDRSVAYNRANSAWEAVAFAPLQGNTPSSMTTGEWHLIVATFDGGTDERVRLYLDGNHVGQTEFAGRGDGPARLRFGARAEPGAPSSFVGRMDNLFVFGSVLTPAQVRTIHANGLAGIRQVAGVTPSGPSIRTAAAPRTWALMLAGLGVLGLTRRRRGRTESTPA